MAQLQRRDLGRRVSEQMLNTRWGDWFPLLCATVALLGLVAERVL
jgi:apolipoprotein N-acyltransferase